jgi:hypothetical protein
MFWTVLTVLLCALALVIVFALPRIWPGRKTFGEMQERFRPWTGFWRKDDADRLR